MLDDVEWIKTHLEEWKTEAQINMSNIEIQSWIDQMVAHETGNVLKDKGYLEGKWVDAMKMEIVDETDSDVPDLLED